MSDSKEKPKVPSTVGAGKYNIEVKLGAGCFGEVYKGVSTENQKAVAVKFEAAQSRSLQLGHEAEILNILRKPTLPQGVAELFFFGQEGNWHVLVMEVLGKSLEDRMEECKSSQGLTVQSVVLIADQVIRRIEYLHSKAIQARHLLGLGEEVRKCSKGPHDPPAVCTPPTLEEKQRMLAQNERLC